MKRYLIILILVAFVSFQSIAQKCSFLILGDMHYDLLGDHDMDWLSTKPDDLRQVSEEYTVYTENHWSDFMGVLQQKVQSEKPPIKAVIQLGDLSEGLAGSMEKARQMASNTMKAIDATQMPCSMNHCKRKPRRYRTWCCGGFSRVLCSHVQKTDRSSRD